MQKTRNSALPWSVVLGSQGEGLGRSKHENVHEKKSVNYEKGCLSASWNISRILQPSVLPTNVS